MLRLRKNQQKKPTDRTQYPDQADNAMQSQSEHWAWGINTSNRPRHKPNVCRGLYVRLSVTTENSYTPAGGRKATYVLRNSKCRHISQLGLRGWAEFCSIHTESDINPPKTAAHDRYNNSVVGWQLIKLSRTG